MRDLLKVYIKLYIKQCYFIVWSIKKRKTENQSVAKKNKGKLMPLSKCVACDSRKPRFIKNQKVMGYYVM